MKGIGRSRSRSLAGGRLPVAVAAALGVASAVAGPAWAHKPPDPLHGGQGAGVTVIGHSSLGGAALNGQLDVLGDHAYVGAGTNGGFAAQWNKTPTCATLPNKVKVVSLKDPADPTVVSTIDLTLPGEDPGGTLARAVSVIKVRPLSAANAFTGDLLAVALESCQGQGRLGVELYDVSNPSRPIRLGTDTPGIGTATRDVSLIQRPDGRVLALAANQSGGIRVVEVTAPAAAVPVGTFGASNPGQGCRPFSFAQGVATNTTGSRAYAAFGDAGLVTLDISNPMPGSTPPKLTEALYGASEEGNSFRFVPNAAETAALATDDDLNPARTTLTIPTGPASLVTEPGASAPGVFRGCEAIWGNPLYRQATPSLADRQVVFVANGGCPADYAGRDVTGKVVLVDRVGSGECFGFDGKARIAQQQGAAAVLVANTGATQLFFSPDSATPGDSGVKIPLVLIRKEAGDAIRAGLANSQTVVGTLADNPDTWGALRIFNLPSPPAKPTQAAVFNAPRTNVLTPGDGLYHAVNPLWDGDRALVAWMSDGLRVVDLRNRSAPQAGPFYVPPGVADPTGNYGEVPLVVDVAKFGERVVISDINGGLYVLEVQGGSAPPGDDGPPGGGNPPGGGTPGGGPPGAGDPLAGCSARAANLISGSSARNSITGTITADRILAGGGDDSVDGLAGDDCLDLGAGADRGQGGPDEDLVLGGPGRDRIGGSSGKDRLRGGSDRDRISGGRGDDTALGDRGNDVVRGGRGADVLRGALGRDRLLGSGGRDRISGGSGGDAISAGGSNDRVAGGSGSDRVSGGSGKDVLRGGPGNDRLKGGRGRDRISGGGGRDRIEARDGRRERITCGRGRDSVTADPGDRVSRDCERVRR